MVEDTPDVRDALKILLELRGYKIVVASNGKEALSAADEHSPDLILMDIAMPLVNGIDATRAIRANTSTSHIPIICVSSFKHIYQRQAIEAGCDAVYTKTELISNMEQILEKYLAENEKERREEAAQ